MLGEPGKSLDLELVGSQIGRRRSADLVGEVIGTPLTPLIMDIQAVLSVGAVSLDTVNEKDIHIEGMEEQDPLAAGAEGYYSGLTTLLATTNASLLGEPSIHTHFYVICTHLLIYILLYYRETPREIEPGV